MKTRIYAAPAVKGLMLGQRCSRWANINPTKYQCIVFAEKSPATHTINVYSDNVIMGIFNL